MCTNLEHCSVWQRVLDTRGGGREACVYSSISHNAQDKLDTEKEQYIRDKAGVNKEGLCFIKEESWLSMASGKEDSSLSIDDELPEKQGGHGMD